MKSSEAVVLVRLSQKRDEEGGLERQEADCRAYCDRVGLTVVLVVPEVQSAFSRKERPEQERAIRESAGKALVVWKLDRLTRQGMTGLGRILERLQEQKTVLHSVTESIDASSPYGRGVLGILASVAEQSSADASLRIKRATAEQAKAGKKHGGRPRFGWGPGEPELVREAAASVTRGQSLRSLAADWNARGIKTALGGNWGASSIGRVLRSEALLGIRVHLGERYPAEWEALLSEAEFSALGAALRQHKTSPSGKATLLQGLLVCGKCGHRMRATAAAVKGGPLRYGCIKEPGKGGCFGVFIYRHLADAAVREEVERVWAIWEAAAPAPVVDTAAQLHREREALAQLVHDHYVSRLISRDLFLPSYQELQDRIAELESQEIGTIVPDAQTIEQKLKACVSHVEINPVRSEKERVKVLFRMGWLSERAGMVV